VKEARFMRLISWTHHRGSGHLPPEGIQINLNNNKLTELQDNNLTVKMTENSKTTAAKFLGVHFDPKLNLKTHIQTIQSKKNQGYFFLSNK
jgi:hypothetical protein